MEWVSVKEKKPEDDHTVMGWKVGQGSRIPIMCYYDEEEKAFAALFSWQEMYIDIDYWAYLPEPPKE